MRIAVVGYKGVVGNATYQLFKKLGGDVVGIEKGEQLTVAGVYFVCVPEDSVPVVVGDLERYIHYSKSTFLDHLPLIVVRSSVIPGTCNKLQRALSVRDLHICHVPEFLREAMAVQDEFSPDKIVLGVCCKRHQELLGDLFGVLQRPIIITDPTTSEMVKLASNCYFSTVISYWNQIDKICKYLDVNSHEVGMIVSLDHRISSYGARYHAKYGLRCLPKDTKQLINFCQEHKIHYSLLEAVEDINNSLEEEI